MANTTTYTRNLRLRLSPGLTTDAVYNLERLDSAISGYVTTSTSGVTLLRGTSDIIIEPNCADIGGSGAGGTVSIGTSSHTISSLLLYASSVKILGNDVLTTASIIPYSSLSPTVQALLDHSNRAALDAVAGINTGDETTSSIKTKLGAASASQDGYLTAGNWSAFNSKEVAGTASGLVAAHESTYNHSNIAHTNRSDLDVVSGTNTGDETTSSIKSKLGDATSITDGYLTALDWNTFNGKEASGTASGLMSTHNSTYTHANIAHTNRAALDAVSGTNTGDETTSSIKTKLGAASAGADGYLTVGDWNTFNGKEASGTAAGVMTTHNLAFVHNDIAHTNRVALDAVSGTNTGDETTSSIKTKLGAAATGADGYLTSTDWNTFNGKQNTLTFGDLTGTANRTSVSGGTGAVIGSGASVNIDTSLLPSPSSGDVGKALIATGANAAAWTALTSFWEYGSAGALATPTYTDNGAGGITTNSTDVTLYDNATFQGRPTKYTLSAISATLTDGVMNYVVGDYNGGSPIMRIITDVDLITESDIIPLISIFRDGTLLEAQNWDTLGRGLSNKLHQSIVKTQRYRRASGLSLSESGTRNVTCSSGIVWVGGVKYTLDTVASATDNIIYFARTGGAWVKSSITQYNNTQYSDGTDTQTLTNNRYAVNWLYRGIEDYKHLYMVLGSGNYTINQAQESQPPANLPSRITSHAMLVGRVIVRKSASTATAIQSAFDITFAQGAVSDHDNLTNLQGGTAGEYYHMTSAQQADLGALGSLTAGSILFAGTDGVIAQSNSQLFFNSGNNRIGFGTASPTTKFQIGNNSEQIVQKLYCGGANGSPVHSLFHTGSAEGIIFQSASRFGIGMTGGVANYQSATLESAAGLMFDNSNRCMIGSTDPYNRRLFVGGSTNEIKMSVRGSATQSQHLQTWESSNGGAVAYISYAGNFRAQGLSFGTRVVANNDQGFLDSDYLVLASTVSTNYTLTLPVAYDNGGRCLVVKRTDANTAYTITIAGNVVGEKIDGATTIALTTRYQCVTLICDGFNWWIA